jgi:cytoskeletal protein RodZ
MAKRKKSEDESPEQNDADNFGLPDIDYKPLDETQEPVEEETPVEQVVVEQTTTYTYEPENKTQEERPVSTYSSYSQSEEKSKAPMVIGLIIGLVIVAALGLLYFYVYKPAAEKARQEEIAKENERKRKENEARLAREKEEEERKRKEAEEAAKAKPAIGTIETLSDRTRRYYVVVSSAVDGDLIMDYAKKLSVKGTSTKIIPPFGKWKFFRLAVGDYDTYATAQANADGVKGEYGSGVWVIKY